MQIPMDPNDLESFFLNKDKKKKSKKVYTINPATLLEQTREQELKKAKKVTEKHQQSQEPKSELLRKTKEDDEWEDAPDIEVDISNLRIGMMPQKADDAKPQSKTDNVDCKHSDESDSDSARRPDKSAHPWGQRPVAKPLELGEVVAEPQQPAKYVPPSQRGGDASRGAARTAKKAPNIANSVEFPSLREMADIETDNADGSWCRVIKNGHSTAAAAAASSSSSATVSGSQSSSDHAAKKYIPSAESSAPAAAASQSASSNSADKPAKYVPPHLRNRAAANHSANENRFAALKDEANN